MGWDVYLCSSRCFTWTLKERSLENLKILDFTSWNPEGTARYYLKLFPLGYHMILFIHIFPVPPCSSSYPAKDTHGGENKFNAALEKEREDSKTLQNFWTNCFYICIIYPLKSKGAGRNRTYKQSAIIVKMLSSFWCSIHWARRHRIICSGLSSHCVCSVKYLPIPAPLLAQSCSQGQGYWSLSPWWINGCVNITGQILIYNNDSERPHTKNR